MAAIIEAPLTWEDVSTIVQRGKNDVAALSAIGRCEDDYAIYTEYCGKLKQEWVTVGDHMRAKLFSASTRTGADGKLEVDVDLDTTTTTCHILVMRNEFPYSLSPQDGVAHVNIWCSSQALEDEVVERLIAERLPCDEYVWFVNPPQLRSVKTLWHCHIFARNLGETARLSMPGGAELFDPAAYLAKA